MNVEELNTQLRNDPDLIIKVLVKLGFSEDKIKYHASKGYITSTRPEEDSDNLSAFVLYCNSLNWQYNTRSGKGNLYTLVMDRRSVNFPQALKLIAKWINYKFQNENEVKHVLPFGGCFKRVLVNRDATDTDLEVYNTDLLPPQACNKRFMRDGISYMTQQHFDLRFDCESNSIIIPIYNSNYELVGSKARKNEDCFIGNKYWASLPFSKTSVVYGLAQNYKTIVEKRKVIILEAEKSVMQCYDFGCYIAVAIMGHDISRAQAKIIKSLFCSEIIIAFDEGVSECDIKKAAGMVYSDNAFYKNKVSYLYGGLPKGSKQSPSDSGKVKFMELLKTQKKTYFKEDLLSN